MAERLLSITAAAQEARVSRITLRRRLDESEIPSFRDPRDRRVRLIRASDLDRVLELQPIGNPSLSEQGDPERIAG